MSFARLSLLSVLAVTMAGLPLVLSCRPDPAESPVPLLAGANVLLLPDEELIRGLVPRHTTLDALLRQYLPTESDVHDVVAAVRHAFDPRRLRALQPFTIGRTPEGDLSRFEYEIDGGTFLQVTRAPGSEEIRASLQPIPRQRTEATAQAAISRQDPSLFQAMRRAGEGPDLAVAMADVLSGEVDFNTELQPGDRFGLVFEKLTRTDGASTYGAILAAELQVGGRAIRAVRFTMPDGTAGYYDEHGQSLRRFFLRSPLKFEPRITSGFSRRRFHPVLKTSRPHLGVDYGAPVGAPVVAVASGTVVSATSDRVNGRMVRLRHAQGYETYYLHLSRFAQGLRRGARVGQGEVIGFVGATGLATGPHLDYRMRKNGVFVDPVREHAAMPPGAPVPAELRAAFDAERDRTLAQLTSDVRAD